MFENVDGRMTDGVTGILKAPLGAFGSGELKNQQTTKLGKKYVNCKELYALLW